MTFKSQPLDDGGDDTLLLTILVLTSCVKMSLKQCSNVTSPFENSKMYYERLYACKDV